ncbi:MAG TPA: YqjK family protein [Burkholderiales bacterium]|nr:YqjK family protein [Burkholderiales bacterium]
MSATERLIELARRKERLIARAAAQRAEIAAILRRWQAPLEVADRALAVARFLRAHPLLVAAAAAAVVTLGRRRLLGLAGRGLAAWRLLRALRGWAAKLSA